MGILLFIFICYLAAFVLTAGAIPFPTLLIPLLVCITAIFFGAMAVEVQLASSPPIPAPARPNERTPLLTPSNDTEAARPVHGDRRVLEGPRWWTKQFDIIGSWVSLASAVLMICFGAASLIVARLWKPPFFSLGWAFMTTFPGLIICPAGAILFAVGNLVRLRLGSRMLPVVINAIVDTVISLNLFTKIPWTIDHGLVLCMVPVGNPLGMERCKDFASKILVLIWLYLAFAFTLGTVHLALFFMRLFRIFGLALGSGQNTPENGIVSSFRLPVHTTTYEFSFKVLRQEPPSGQDHARQEQAQDAPVEE